MQITKKVFITIEDRELLGLLIRAIAPGALEAEGREKVLFYAFGHLTGISAVDAVTVANRYARENSLPEITSREFRAWLPEMLSGVLGKFVNEEIA